MTAIHDDYPGALAARRSDGPGPVSRGKLARTGAIYAVAVILGYLPVLLQASPALQAAGLGLWFPGAGFIAVGGWAIALVPVALAVFALSLLAWFGAGMVLAPLVAWLGAAAVAALMAGEAAWPPAAFVVPGLTVVFFGYTAWRSRQRVTADRARLAMRQTFLPQALTGAAVRAAPVPTPGSRELSTEDLAALRYAFDRALQPVGEFGGYNIIDQFQTASLRYQINTLGYTLGLLQCHYTPSFQGYLAQAQRNLTETYLSKKVWGYWVYETAWGHLNVTDFDPAARDNIMLTGWLGLQLGLEMSAGHRDYAEPGSLPFRLNAKTTYQHDIHTITGSLVSNFKRSAFGLYPCEPNWLYPICNHYGMTSLAIYDRLFGTDHTQKLLGPWLEKLDSEFTDAKGSIIGLRSELTGLELPFPTGEIAYVSFMNALSPERARRMWAIARTELGTLMRPGEDGRMRIVIPGKGFDFGNYRPGSVGTYASIITAAREFGDEEMAAAAQLTLDETGGRTVENGVLRYETGSNLTNLAAIQARIRGRDDYRNAIVAGPAASTLTGPVLADVRYPDVLVAKAFSDGEGLELVLHPGAGEARQALRLARLRPGQAYGISGAEETHILADSQGAATLTVRLDGRTEIRVTPANP